MVDYAKRMGWSAPEKALIYGAYMHTIHDFYAHEVTQPSLYGHPYVLESDSTLQYVDSTGAVSYTHLTLPTKRIV